MKPNYLVPIDFDQSDLPNSDTTSFSSLAICLGFSPNGKYLAFHSNGLSTISVLKYSGIERSKSGGDTLYASDIFGKISRADLTCFSREHNYDNEQSLGSWWTDDSSTIILQLSMKGSREDDDIPNASEEETLSQAYSFVYDGRASGASTTTMSAELREMMNMIDGKIEPDEPGNESEEEVSDYERKGGYTQSYRDYVHDPVYEERTSGEESSRTLPAYRALALKKLERWKLNVFELIDIKSDEESSEETFNPNQPSTSSDISLLDDSQHDSENEPYQKRFKSSNLSVADLLRNALKSNKETNTQKPKRRRKFITKNKYLHRMFPDDTHLILDDYERSIETDKKMFYANRLRRMIQRHDFPDLPRVNSKYLRKADGATVAFVAYNIETKRMSLLFFNKVKSKFQCHIRDRKLVVVFNSDLIESYQLTKNDQWIQNEKFHLSTKIPRPIAVHFRTGTMPGMSSKLLETDSGEMFNDLFDSECFNSPLQQDVAAVIHRDMERWVDQNDSLITETPEVTRCHFISDDLVSVTLTYRNRNQTAPILIGVIISLKEMTVNVYPDYHKFLKLLFIHHLPDILPRHWTYLNPSPANQQNWFREGVINLLNSDDIDNFELLNNTYDFISSNWNNVKSTSNPLTSSIINNSDANCFFSKYVISCAEDYLWPTTSQKFTRMHMEQYYHPVDPFILVNKFNKWWIACRQKDPDDVILHNN